MIDEPIDHINPALIARALHTIADRIEAMGFETIAPTRVTVKMLVPATGADVDKRTATVDRLCDVILDSAASPDSLAGGRAVYGEVAGQDAADGVYVSILTSIHGY